MTDEVVGRVPSLSNPRTFYDITLRRSRFGTCNDELICSCQAFYAWKKRGLKCWHLRIFEAASKALDRCWEYHGTQDGFVCASCLIGVLAKAASVVKNEYVKKEEAASKIKLARAAKKKKRKTKKKESSYVEKV